MAELKLLSLRLEMALVRNWWKGLGVLLVLGSITIGLLTKTGPGVAVVSPGVVDASSTFSFTLTGYNTDFYGESAPSVWLKYKDRLFCADAVLVEDIKTLRVSFPPFDHRIDTVSRIATSVLIEDEVNGMFLGLDALQLNFNEVAVDTTTGCSIRPDKLEAIKFQFPFRTTLYETIRNLNFHVPMWFAMIAVLFLSWIASIRNLNSGDRKWDHLAYGFATAGLLFGIAGITTGAFWARFTWGTFWTADPKLNGAAIGVLLFVAYQILRSSIDDEDKVARISSVYNVLAFPIFIVLIIILPVLAKFSLHPGSGDSVGFKQYDLNNNLRMVFYPAVLGWVLVATWVGQLISRVKAIEEEQEMNAHE